jgi:hypothetical protein
VDEFIQIEYFNQNQPEAFEYFSTNISENLKESEKDINEMLVRYRNQLEIPNISDLITDEYRNNYSLIRTELQNLSSIKSQKTIEI